MRLKNNFGAHLQQTAASVGDRPVRVLALDEARFGLKSQPQRRWSPCGCRPPWIVQDRYQWLWLYAAVEPDTGASCCLYLPYLDTVCFQLFIDQLRRTYAEDHLLLVMGSGRQSSQPNPRMAGACTARVLAAVQSRVESGSSGGLKPCEPPYPISFLLPSTHWTKP